MSARIDEVRIRITETTTPFADLIADPWLSLLHLPMVEVARPWPLRPLQPTASRKGWNDGMPPWQQIAAGLVGAPGTGRHT